MSLSCANRKSRRDADEEVLEGAGGPRAVPVEVGGVGCGPAAGLAPEEGEDVEVQTARKVIWDAGGGVMRLFPARCASIPGV